MGFYWKQFQRSSATMQRHFYRTKTEKKNKKFKQMNVKPIERHKDRSKRIKCVNIKTKRIVCTQYNNTYLLGAQSAAHQHYLLHFHNETSNSTITISNKLSDKMCFIQQQCRCVFFFFDLFCFDGEKTENSDFFQCVSHFLKVNTRRPIHQRMFMC